MKLKPLLTSIVVASVMLTSGALFGQETSGTLTFGQQCEQYVQAKNWTAVVNLCTPLAVGNYVYDSTDASQQLANTAINYMGRALGFTVGGGAAGGSNPAAYDFYVAHKFYSGAAGCAQYFNPAKAVENQLLVVAIEPTTNNKANLLLFKKLAGTNVNAEAMTFLQSVDDINKNVAQALFNAFSPGKSTVADAIAYYNQLLLVVESNEANADFIGRVLDQKNKLTK